MSPSYLQNVRRDKQPLPKQAENPPGNNWGSPSRLPPPLQFQVTPSRNFHHSSSLFTHFTHNPLFLTHNLQSSHLRPTPPVSEMAALLFACRNLACHGERFSQIFLTFCFPLCWGGVEMNIQMYIPTATCSLKSYSPRKALSLDLTDL